MKKPQVPKTFACPACGELNEPPFLFCEHCGSPLLKLGKWRITFNLMFAYFVFMGNWLLTAPLDGALGLGFSLFVWDWPIFLLFDWLLMQFAGWLVSGLFKSKAQLLVWNFFFVAAAVAYSEAYHRSEQGDVITFLLAEVPNLATTFPLIFYPALAALLTIFFIPPMLRWAKQYGWVHAYRLTMITLIMIPALGLLALAPLPWIYANWPSQTGFIKDLLRVRPSYQLALGLAVVTLSRLLVFEVFIYASITSYAKTRIVRFQTDPQVLARASGMVRATIGLVMHLKRFVLTLENMLHYLISTLRDLAVEMGRIIAHFMKEVFFPFIAMLAMMLLLYITTVQTRVYITTISWLAMGEIVACIIGLTGCVTLFFACKAPLRPAKLVANELQILGLMLPNMMVFFLLLSVTLYATAVVVNGHGTGNEHEMPYRLGPLTITVGVILAILVIGILVRKRSLFSVAPAAEGAALAGTAVVGAASAQPIPSEAPSNVEPESKKSRLKTALEGTMEKTGVLNQVKGIGKKAAGVKQQMGDWLKDKPPLVDKLEKLRETMEEKKSQWQSLMAMKASISPETFEHRRLELKSEILGLRGEYQNRLLELNQKAAQYQDEVEKLERRLQQSESQLAELTTMIGSGAMSAAEAKARKDMLTLEVNILNQKLAKARQQLEFLQPVLVRLKLEQELGGS